MISSGYIADRGVGRDRDHLRFEPRERIQDWAVRLLQREGVRRVHHPLPYEECRFLSLKELIETVKSGLAPRDINIGESLDNLFDYVVHAGNIGT